MSYVMRVRFASFFTGAALASAAGIYFLQNDYKIAHNAIYQQVNTLYEYLEGRVTALEKLKEVEALQKSREVEAAPKHVDTSDPG